MRTHTKPKRLMAMLLCMVMMLSLLPGGLTTNAYAAGCTHVHTSECLSCEKAEHTHTEDCYETQLTCAEEEHTHTAECYEAVLSCTEAEHTHGEDCYDAEGNLICELAEHTHTEDCYTQNLLCEKAEHTHTEDCYTKSLICTLEEHTHTEECYQNCTHICGEECGVAVGSGEPADGTTPESGESAPAELSQEAQAFVQAVDALDGEAMLAAVNTYKEAAAAAEAEPDNEELQQAAEAAGAAMDAATAPIAAAFALYDEVPVDELDNERVTAALTALNELAVTVQKAMDTQGELLGTLGGTAPKLDGDWAYLTKFEILDDPTTTGVVEGIMDGSGPFDTDTDPNSWTYKDRQGNDENDQNGKVRSFDTVTYKLNYATATSGEYDFVKEGWMNYEMVLPYASTRATWQTDSMAWVGTKVADQAALDGIQEQTSGYYLATETRQGVLCQVLRGKFWIAPNESNPYAIPGEGTLSAVVQVLAMEEGQTLKPSFSAWMEHNTTDQTTCGKHRRDEIISFTAPATTVTAEVRMDIQVNGSAKEGLGTYDFNTGNAATAPNYGKGSVIGKAETYGIGVFLWNGDANKGRKGLMAPASGDTITFDLSLSASVWQTNTGAGANLDNTAYAPLLWALGSNDNAMDWKGRNTLTASDFHLGLAANTAFGGWLKGSNACYDGGNWSFTVDPSDPNKIHVTITSMEIDLTNFPHYDMNGNSYDTSGVIPISSGQLQLVQPVEVNGTHMMEDTTLMGTGTAMGSGDVATSVKDNNMHYSYVSKTDGQTHTLDNNAQTNLTNDVYNLYFYTEKGGGDYYAYSLWSSKPTADGFQWIGTGLFDTTGGNYYTDKGGDPTVRTQSIGAFVGFYHRNDVPGDGGTTVAAKSFLKFDSAAVTPTGVNTCYINTLNKYQYKVLYAAKSDGTAWTDDTEMETTSMLSPTIQFYDSLSAITASGKQCVGVLVEYLPVDASYTGIEPAYQDMFVNIGLTVNANAAEGALYQCTQEVLAWSRDAYEGASKSIPSLSGTRTLPTESWHWQPDYNKGHVEFHGRLVGDTGGYQWGDVMQVIAGKSSITKEVAQQENGVNKSVYYMDSDQRFVDYKLNVSTEYVTYNVVTTPTGITTTLKILDGMMDGLTYVPNSAYYGGTYTQNPIPGRQGTVTGGTPLTLIASYPDGQYTWYEFEIPNVEIGKPLQPIYLTAKIGTRGVESTDVYDGQKILNISHAQIGKEITTTREDNGDMGLAAIIISKNGATSRSKLADQTYIEKGDAFNWTINVGNNGGSTMPNVVALDTMENITDTIECRANAVIRADFIQSREEGR